MYISNNIADRIRLIAKSKNVSVKKLLYDVGLGFNTMSNMKTSMPKVDNLAKIADYLECSVDYLLGRTDNRQANKEKNICFNSGQKKLKFSVNSHNTNHSQNFVEAVAQSSKSIKEKIMPNLMKIKNIQIAM